MWYHNKRMQENLSVKKVCDRCLFLSMNTYPLNGCYDAIDSML